MPVRGSQRYTLLDMSVPKMSLDFALGYKVKAEADMAAEARREILSRLAAGEITAEEAARQLREVRPW